MAVEVFLSHSLEDTEAAKRLSLALRQAGADVWFYESNPGVSELFDEIQRELRARRVFLVLLSNSAVVSQQVKNECKWAFNIQLRVPNRIILPVVISKLGPDAFDDMQYLESFLRIEGPNHTPHSEAEMVERIQRLLPLNPVS